MRKLKKPSTPIEALEMSFERLNYWSGVDEKHPHYKSSHIDKEDGDLAAKTIDRLFEKTDEKAKITLLPRLEEYGDITITFEAYDGFDFEIGISEGVISRVEIRNYSEEDNDKLLSIIGM